MTDQTPTRADAIDLADYAATRLAVLLDQHGDIIHHVHASIIYLSDFHPSPGPHHYVEMAAHYRRDVRDFLDGQIDPDDVDDEHFDLRTMPLLRNADDRAEVTANLDLLIERCNIVRELFERSANIPF